jgi:hypothetical protein
MFAFWLLFCIILLTIAIILAIVLSISSYNVPKVVYTFWDNIDEDKVINAIVATQERNLPREWKLKIISQKNVHQYVDAQALERWKDESPTRFSDFLRLYLLSKNGGVWMDSGIILLDGSYLDDYYHEMMKTRSDILLYEFKALSLENQFYLENWFFMSPKNSKFMSAFYREFELSRSMGFLKYKNQILTPMISSKNLRLQNEDTYHMQHGIIPYLLKKNHYKVIIKDAEESMFMAQNKSGWDHDKLINFIVENNDWTGYYAIKLTGANREGIDSCKERFITKMQSL